MSWLRTHRLSAVLVALSLAVPAALLLSLLVRGLALGLGVGAQIDRLEPRIARMEGVLLEADALARAAREAQATLASLAYGPEEDPAALAATLQADLRRLLEEAGLDVSNSQVLNRRELERFDLVAIKLTSAGTLEALDNALVAIAAFRPALLLESVDVFPTPRAGGNAQDVTAVLRVGALRVMST